MYLNLINPTEWISDLNGFVNLKIIVRFNTPITIISHHLLPFIIKELVENNLMIFINYEKSFEP